MFLLHSRFQHTGGVVRYTFVFILHFQLRTFFSCAAILPQLLLRHLPPQQLRLFVAENWLFSLFCRSCQVPRCTKEASLWHIPRYLQQIAGVTAHWQLFPAIAAALFPGNKQPELLLKTPVFGAKTAAVLWQNQWIAAVAAAAVPSAAALSC
jgi:hypothetical protein